MKILRAEHLGMCFGVRDAIALATQAAATQPLTVLGDLVHNETVLARLRAQGIQFQKEAAAGDDHRAWRIEPQAGRNPPSRADGGRGDVSAGSPRAPKPQEACRRRLS